MEEKTLFDEDVIYLERNIGCISAETITFSVKDGDDPVIEKSQGSYFSVPDEVTYQSISKDDVNKIKELIDNTKRLFDGTPLEDDNCEFGIIDGVFNQFFFRSGNKVESGERTVFYEIGNFFYRYYSIPDNTKAGELLNLIRSIYKILSKYDDYFYEPDDDEE